MKKLLFSLCLCTALGHATDVLIPVDSMFNGALYGKTLTITPVNGLIFDETHLYAGSYLNVPSHGTNPIVRLQPNSYLLTAPDVRPAVRFNVWDSTNVLNLITDGLITSGPLFFFGTNGFANLLPGDNVTFITNEDGSILVSATGGTATNVISYLFGETNLPVTAPWITNIVSPTLIKVFRGTNTLGSWDGNAATATTALTATDPALTRFKTNVVTDVTISGGTVSKSTNAAGISIALTVSPGGGGGTNYLNSTDPAGVVNGNLIGTNLTPYATTALLTSTISALNLGNASRVDTNTFKWLSAGTADTATSATTATSFTGSLSGDVTGTQGATVVSSVSLGALPPGVITNSQMVATNAAIQLAFTATNSRTLIALAATNDALVAQLSTNAFFTNTIFVRIGGSDSNPGTDIGRPKATITNAVATATALSALGYSVIIKLGVGSFDADLSTTNGIWLTNNVKLTGEGRSQTRINLNTNNIAFGFIIAGDNVTISDMTIGTNVNQGFYYFPVSQVKGTNASLFNVAIPSDSDGFYCSSAGPTLTNRIDITFDSCRFDFGYDGIVISAVNGSQATNSMVLVKNCVFKGNQDQTFGAVQWRCLFLNHINATIQDCILTQTNSFGGSTPYGIFIGNIGGTYTFRGNIFSGSGITVGGSTPVINIKGTMLQANLVSGGATVNYDDSHLRAGAGGGLDGGLVTNIFGGVILTNAGASYQITNANNKIYQVINTNSTGGGSTVVINQTTNSPNFIFSQVFNQFFWQTNANFTSTLIGTPGSATTDSHFTATYTNSGASDIVDTFPVTVFDVIGQTNATSLVIPAGSVVNLEVWYQNGYYFGRSDGPVSYNLGSYTNYAAINLVGRAVYNTNIIGGLVWPMTNGVYDFKTNASFTFTIPTLPPGFHYTPNIIVTNSGASSITITAPAAFHLGEYSTNGLPGGWMMYINFDINPGYRSNWFTSRVP